MVYNKHITSEGKDQILKLAFLGNNNTHPFQYCALGYLDDALASVTGITSDFSEFKNNYGYHRMIITQDKDIENNTLYASCIFDDDNYNTDTGSTIGEIALCDSFDSDSPTYFAFSQVPEIIKTGNVSVKYTWIITIE